MCEDLTKFEQPKLRNQRHAVQSVQVDMHLQINKADISASEMIKTFNV